MISTDLIKELQHALRILKSRLYDIELTKRQKKQIEWARRYEAPDTQGVLDGGLNDFMKLFLMENN